MHELHRITEYGVVPAESEQPPPGWFGQRTRVASRQPWVVTYWLAGKPRPKTKLLPAAARRSHRQSWAGTRATLLSWQLSITQDARFCLEALDVALERYGRPEIFNTDQRSQFNSRDWMDKLEEVTIDALLTLRAYAVAGCGAA